jgi:phosphoribosylaminoimidazolecarboxamide formyltransferase/IMP cyclohydrolase
MGGGRDLPVEVLNGAPGYINLLDALNAWQLVSELKEATGVCAAASFKHVSPAGAAIGLPLTDALRKAYFCEDFELSPVACAYARARGADRASSYGDFIALSDVCDVSAARIIALEVSDGVIAPGYEPEALRILKGKRKGNYNIIKIDGSYTPDEIEVKQVYGVFFEQGRNSVRISGELLRDVVTEKKEFPDERKRDLLISLITLKYTQSNSVCYATDGQAVGVGAGQQSRIYCTRLAGDKADLWRLRQSPQALSLKFRDDLRRPERDNAVDLYLSDESEDALANGGWRDYFAVKPEVFSKDEKRDWLSRWGGICLGSDAFFPFSDNIERAKRSGVSYIAQPGGSVRDRDVIAACDKHGITMAFTGVRLFHH